MSEPHSTSAAAPVKRERPAGSPFYWHTSGRWAKKIRGRLCYFGRGSHDDALAEYNRLKADLHAGRVPRAQDDGALTVAQLCIRFLTAKQAQRDNGELSPRMFLEYGASCKRLTRVFGKSRLVGDLRPSDFAALRESMARSWGLVRLKAEIVRSRTPFNWAQKQGLIDRPPTMGEAFNVPTAGALRRHRSKQGPKLFAAAELGRMLRAAGQPLRTMILLGINCGFGNGDVAALTVDALDLAAGWLTFPRPKTGIARRVPLWPETARAVGDWLGVRPDPADPADAGLVFVTYKRGSWKDDTGRALSHETRKLLDRLKIEGRGFYCLRHTFQTIGDEARDFVAVRKIMGHASNDIADAYREGVSDGRLLAVAEHVRGWLFGDAGEGEGEDPDVLKFRAG